MFITKYTYAPLSIRGWRGAGGEVEDKRIKKKYDQYLEASCEEGSLKIRFSHSSVKIDSIWKYLNIFKEF